MAAAVVSGGVQDVVGHPDVDALGLHCVPATAAEAPATGVVPAPAIEALASTTSAPGRLLALKAPAALRHGFGPARLRSPPLRACAVSLQHAERAWLRALWRL